MAKGFTDSKGNFRPTGNSSRTSSRERSVETSGMSMSEGDRFGNPKGTKYDIVRFYSDGRRNKVIHRNVSDVVADLHTNDPRTRKEGVYFDGFRKVT